MEEAKVVRDKVVAALDGKKQIWLISKLRVYAENMDGEDLKAKYRLGKLSQSTLSKKLNGYEDFKPYELRAISKILKIKF